MKFSTALALFFIVSVIMLVFASQPKEYVTDCYPTTREAVDDLVHEMDWRCDTRWHLVEQELGSCATTDFTGWWTRAKFTCE